MKQRFKSKKSSIFIFIVAAIFLLRIITSLNNFTRDDADSRTWEYRGDLFEAVLIMVISGMVIFRSVEIDDKILKLRSSLSVKKIDIDTIRALKTIKKNKVVSLVRHQLPLSVYGKHMKMVVRLVTTPAIKVA